MEVLLDTCALIRLRSLLAPSSTASAGASPMEPGKPPLKVGPELVGKVWKPDE